MGGVKPIGNDAEFQPELGSIGSRLAVVKFTMRGCGPCVRIAPAFSALSTKYPQAAFLEVDVHQCQVGFPMDNGIPNVIPYGSDGLKPFPTLFPMD
uniref:Uncharacterized protein n=1 Tax=Melopsittacus undulatus TaxID=13146 RepID=A0A8V5H1D5_MELUD